MTQETDFVKIRVDLPDGDLGVFGEGLWAKSLGDDLYEVQNSPWHSREINYLDIVKATPPNEDSRPAFISVEKRSGHRTIQIIILEAGSEKKDVILEKLNKLGGTWEGAHSALFALDFAPSVSWSPAMEYLEQCSIDQILEYRWSAF